MTRRASTIASDDDFAGNPEPRCPCVLLLDVSESMVGQPIDELNAGLTTFKDALVDYPVAMKRVEVAIVTFGEAVVLKMPFTEAERFEPPILTAGGLTPMGEAISEAIRLVKERKGIYRKNGIAYYRPWIFLVTDGEPTDDWYSVSDLVKTGEDAKAFIFYAVGVMDANMDILQQISIREPLKLDGLKFQELFKWLGNSVGASTSTPGADVLPPSPKDCIVR
ncbi:MAG: VWA domain-containing protein [Synergistaceae bacterium]|jgi:uncharacterized protein YegL|nr:VWA domain-containing protein [Synergistaceae bacterium]